MIVIASLTTWFRCDGVTPIDFDDIYSGKSTNRPYICSRRD